MDDDPDFRWVSYSELAAARGIDRASAVRTASNHNWRRRKGNDGKVRVNVPLIFLESRRRRAENSGEISAEIARLEARVAALAEQVDRERGRADNAEARARELADKALDLAVRELTALARADELRATVERLTEFPGAALLARARAIAEALLQKTRGLKRARFPEAARPLARGSEQPPETTPRSP